MPDFAWGDAHVDRLAAIRDDLARVSTATAYQLLIAKWLAQRLHAGILPLAGARPGRAPRRAGADLPLPDAARPGGAARPRGPAARRRRSS